MMYVIQERQIDLYTVSSVVSGSDDRQTDSNKKILRKSIIVQLIDKVRIILHDDDRMMDDCQLMDAETFPSGIED